MNDEKYLKKSELVRVKDLSFMQRAYVLEILKATALDDQYRRARPKRLRFAIFTQFGRVVRHARSRLMRLTTRALDALLRPSLRRIRLAAWAGP